MIYEIPDFSSSRILWKSHSGSYGLWSLEAKLTELNGYGNSIYLCTDVMAGDVYGKDQLPKTPSYHFQAAFSTTGEYRFFRNGQVGPNKDSIGSTADDFESLNIMERTALTSRIHSRDELIGTVESGAILLSTIEYSIGQSSYKLSFPIYHINMRKGEQPYFQVETGPGIMILGQKQSFSLHHIILVQLYYQNYHTVHMLLKDTVNNSRKYKFFRSGAYRDFIVPTKLSECDIRLYKKLNVVEKENGD